MGSLSLSSGGIVAGFVYSVPLISHQFPEVSEFD